VNLFAVTLIGNEIVGGQDDGVASEAVAKGVERRALLAGVGAGAGGVLGVGPICFGAMGWGLVRGWSVPVGDVVVGNVRHDLIPF